MTTDTGNTNVIAATQMPAQTIADYDASAGALKRRFASSHGMQPGDPDKAVAAILASLDAPELPLRLPLGSDALRMIRGKIAKVNEDLSAVEAVASTTDYDGRS